MQGFHSHWRAVISKALFAVGILIHHLISSFLGLPCVCAFNCTPLLNKTVFPSSPECRPRDKVLQLLWVIALSHFTSLAFAHAATWSNRVLLFFDLFVSFPLTKRFLYNTELCQDQNAHSRSFLLFICLQTIRISWETPTAGCLHRAGQRMSETWVQNFLLISLFSSYATESRKCVRKVATLAAGIKGFKAWLVLALLQPQPLFIAAQVPPGLYLLPFGEGGGFANK